MSRIKEVREYKSYTQFLKCEFSKLISIYIDLVEIVTNPAVPHQLCKLIT